MLFLLLLVSPAYAQEEKTEPPTEEVLPPLEESILTEEQLEEQIQEIEEQMKVQVDNTMAICLALGIVCEEEAATKLVEALNEIVVVEPPADTQSPEAEDEDG